MSIRSYSIQAPAVAGLKATAKSSAPDNPPAAEGSSFHRALGKASPGQEPPGPGAAVPAEILSQLVQMQMTESWLRMLEGDGGVEEGLAGRIGRFLSARPPVEESGASKIRHNLQKNGNSGREALAPVIEEASRAYGVDADLIRSVIEVESGFRPDSLSPKGAMGLMQLMPETARELGVEDPYDPRQNILGATRYLRQLIDRYGGDVRTALTAYNWGMGNVDRHPGKMPAETVAYVERVSHHYRELKA